MMKQNVTNVRAVTKGHFGSTHCPVMRWRTGPDVAITPAEFDPTSETSNEKRRPRLDRPNHSNGRFRDRMLGLDDESVRDCARVRGQLCDRCEPARRAAGWSPGHSRQPAGHASAPLAAARERRV